MRRRQLRLAEIERSDFLRADMDHPLDPLERTGDLISTGPTGTNVTDLVIAWRS